MGKQRIVLEYHGDIPFMGRNSVHITALNTDRSPGRFDQSGNHPQCRCFTAAAGTEKRDDFSFFYLQIYAVHRKKFLILFCYVN